MADLQDCENEGWGDPIFGVMSAAAISGTLCVLLRLLPSGAPSSPMMTTALLVLAGQLALASTSPHVSLRAVDVLGLVVACIVFAGDLLVHRVGLSLGIMALAIGSLGRHSPVLRLVTGGIAMAMGLVGVLVAAAGINLPIASLDLTCSNETVGVLALALATVLSDAQLPSRH